MIDDTVKGVCGLLLDDKFVRWTEDLCNLDEDFGGQKLQDSVIYKYSEFRAKETGEK